jgi:hypothetical protein
LVAGLPFPEPTPEQYSNQQLHSYISDWLLLGGLVMVIGSFFCEARCLDIGSQAKQITPDAQVNLALPAMGAHMSRYEFNSCFGSVYLGQSLKTPLFPANAARRSQEAQEA